jgi:hypothetical protein
MGENIRQIAIVGEQYQALTGCVKPADGVQPFGGRHQLAERRASEGILHGRKDPSRFVEHYVDSCLCNPDDLAVHSDLIDGWIDLCTKLDDDASVDGHSTLLYDVLRLAARSDASPSEELLQAF